MNRIDRAVSTAVLLGFATLLLIPATAAAQARTGSLEAYAGEYFPDKPDYLKDDLIYGVRGSYSWTGSLASEVSVGRYEQSFHFAPGAGIDLHETLLDLSTAWTFNPASRARFALFAGPGWAFFDATSYNPGMPDDSGSDDSFTLHAGASLRIDLSDRVYVRPDVRARWIDKLDDAIDYEASVGIGIRLGV